MSVLAVGDIPTLEQPRQRREEIARVAEARHAYSIRVFGSVARGDATPESDIDFLVTFRKGATLYDLSGLWQDLRELLGREVNVLSDGGLRDSFRQQIAGDVTPL